MFITATVLLIFQAEDKSKSTPLHSACSSGSVDVVRRLLISGANFLKCDDEKLTPFHYIVIAGNLEVLPNLPSVAFSAIFSRIGSSYMPKMLLNEGRDLVEKKFIERFKKSIINTDKP